MFIPQMIEKGGGGLGLELGEDQDNSAYNRIKSLVNEELKQYFRPEFLNRLDEIIVFRQLTKDEVAEIAELMLVDALPFSNPGNYQRVAERITKEENEKGNKIFWASQFENLANYKFHEKTTAKEIYDQTDGQVDGFTCAIGTGGTLTLSLIHI